MSAIEDKPADEETAVTTKSNMKPAINGEPQFSLTYALTLSLIVFRPTCIILQRHYYVRSGDPEFNICLNIGNPKEKNQGSSKENYLKALIWIVNV